MDALEMRKRKAGTVPAPIGEGGSVSAVDGDGLLRTGAGEEEHAVAIVTTTSTRSPRWRPRGWAREVVARSLDFRIFSPETATVPKGKRPGNFSQMLEIG